ncbi:putative blumeria specific protein [Golovinomyces cichoracearum]|uniref:Putative blumeria specific protein n=1 Tax=Golovinomyces cichoracearum TaxID=62708 RepID=A0A420J483_9PEZI|nr:putative blumeria specific protein [Golovinomyces cichoracearum]
MAEHLPGKLSPHSRRKSPLSSSSQPYNPPNRYSSQAPRDRFRDRSLPPRRYPNYENDQSDNEGPNRQSNIQPSKRMSLNQISPSVRKSPTIDHREQNVNIEKSKPLKTTNQTVGPIVKEDLRIKQEENFKLLLEAITDISSLKVENKKAKNIYEASREKYERTICHHSRFPNLKTTLQNELDQAKHSVDKINDELASRDGIFRELAGQSLSLLLPAIQVSKVEKSRDNKEKLILERLEKVVKESEKHCSELQEELYRFKEEQKRYQSEKDRQIASQESQLKEIKSSESQKDNEILQLRSQLRSLNDEISSLKNKSISSKTEIKEIKDISEGVQGESARLKAHLIELEGTTQEKLKHLEAQISPVISLKSNLKNLRENGLFNLKASTVDEISATLKVAMGRIDSLPSAASYFSLNSRLEILEKEKVSNLVLHIEDRLKALEATAVPNAEIQSNSQSSISKVEEKVDALSKQVLACSTTSKTEEELASLRSVTGEIQRSLNVVRINLAGLHERTQSAIIQGFDDARVERIVEAKSKKFMAEAQKKITEVSQMLAATNHSVENVISRIDNISTGHLAQAILNQLSETYPHIQNVEQLYTAQGECLRELQAKVEYLSKPKSDFLTANSSLELTQTQQTVSSSNNGRNLSNEVDKLSEDIFKANQNIKKLINATEEDRKTVVDVFSSKLGSLVTTEDLNAHKVEIDKHIKSLMEKSIEEFSKKSGLLQFDKTSKLSDLEALIKTKSDIEATISLAEKNSFSIFTIEKRLDTLKDELITRLASEIQAQKSEFEDLTTAQVDRSLALKHSDLVKEVANCVELKLSVDGNGTPTAGTKTAPNPSSSNTVTTPRAPQAAMSNRSSLRSKRKLNEIKAENFSHTNNFRSSGRFAANKKGRYNSNETNDVS